MTTHHLNIQEKHRQGAGVVASLADFTVSAGEPVDPAVILTNPNLSLYCFDTAAQNAIFTELPDGIDLSTVPFVYQTQYDHAVRLVSVPYQSFRQLALSLPPVEHLIMIYIVGRSGSTLISSIFNELDQVLSLSEPDVGTQILHLREVDHVPEPELREILDCTVRLLFMPTPHKSATIFALKLRSEAVRLMDLYQAAFPAAKNLYSYRDAVGFSASFYRMLKKFDYPEVQPTSVYQSIFEETTLRSFIPLLAYLEPGVQQFHILEYMALWWVAAVEWYLEQADRGLPALAVDYHDLNHHREQTLAAIFEYCGLPVAQVAQALRAYERDSQAGTVLARDNPAQGNQLRLTDDQRASIERILRRHPVIKGNDFQPPNLLRL